MSMLPIGIIDSGFGGLSVYKKIRQLLPREPVVYVGDQAHIPYGGKSAAYIHRRIKKIIRFLLKKKVKLIVIACNTATVAGIDIYRRDFPSVPIIGVVPVIKTAASVTRRNAFCVLSTGFTAGSAYQKHLIQKYASHCNVYNIGGHDLVDFVERGITDGKEVRERLKLILVPPMMLSVDVIALGCTHYPFLKRAIRAIVGKEMVILDSGDAVARHVRRVLKLNDDLSGAGTGKGSFYTTAKDRTLSGVASKLLRKKITVRYEHI